MAFGLFGGISFIGFLLSFGITGDSLEAEGWDEENGPAADGDQNDDESEDEGENQRLLDRR